MCVWLETIESVSTAKKVYETFLKQKIKHI